MAAVMKRRFSILYRRNIMPLLIKHTNRILVDRINLCSGDQAINGYCGIDLHPQADLIIDLARRNLPFRNESIKIAVCISGINYFTRERGAELIRETHRVLKRGGLARFAVQDLECLAKRYVERDRDFYFQTLPDGRQRFTGPTLGDKFASWFYAYRTAGGVCRYAYDYDSLAYLFFAAGFSLVERREFGESRIEGVELIDNRPEQMFFLEAVK